MVESLIYPTRLEPINLSRTDYWEGSEAHIIGREIVMPSMLHENMLRSYLLSGMSLIVSMQVKAHSSLSGHVPSSLKLRHKMRCSNKVISVKNCQMVHVGLILILKYLLNHCNLLQVGYQVLALFLL
jgi:hypothetical protein